MDTEQSYPAEPLDHKRPEFEAGAKRIAIERFGYTAGDAMLKTILERNRSGRYVVDWVRGAWEGFNMAQPQQFTASAPAIGAIREPIIYSTKLTAHQNAVLAKFENMTGQPPMGLEEFETGELNARELWRQQTAWAEAICADVINLDFLSADD